MDDFQKLVLRLHIDMPLLVGLIALSSVGVLVLYSAGGENMDLVMRQGVRLGLGFLVMMVLAQVDPRHLYRLAPWLYLLGIVLLLSVLFVGEIGKGARRWLDLGVVNFQPSEIMKIAVPMMVAWVLADKRVPPHFSWVLLALVLIGVPAVLIANQPDLGTALLVSVAGLFVLLLSGVSWRWVGGSALLAALSTPLLWYSMHSYQRQRVLTFLNPEQDPLGSGYHIIQSKIAIGSGGIFGKGWLNGTQSHLNFVPERSTDFIFSVFSEEFGLLGVLLLFVIYLFVIARGLYMATQVQETFGRLLAGSLVLTFFVYLFVNTSMVMGLLPVVGVPLPLVSYGGTSLVTLMASFGMLMSVHTHRRLLSS